ncbi:aminotransferase-like domain-containing protein [Sedimentitalea todarodis]|uniref:PLP-dependent aminotransferase family protein n=1 Tax=Sedimentitalea todarodis TaxID=1631240 RepID=A0ABU3VLM9_9RHOB|nr:PLP-dependent aminotransferase family protein [Sedimentitalea todarodis]MDU9007097.1 PLP-dependent aminotransferase family protein [Sedimentitalea todarodis]
MSFEIQSLFASKLPDPAPQPFSGFPRYNFVGGHNDATSIPVQALKAAALRVLDAEGASLATYYLTSGPQGHLPLRQFIAKALARNAQMGDGAENILTTSGSLQALDLVNRLLLNEGDTVIAEEASYGGALGRLKRLGVNCRGVRVDQDGIDMQELRSILEDQKARQAPVKYIYTIPTVQNPTGGVMSLERRKTLLQLAAEFDCVIFEDDCYADLLWGAPRPRTIRSLDAAAAQAQGRANRVIYCGSFSKSIAPALRVGYLIADWTVLAQILPLKTDAGTGALEQMVLAEFCREHFDDHIAGMQKMLKRKCDVMVEALNRSFGAAAEFVAPSGGIFIWITLPEEVDTTQLAAAAAGHGIAINPGAEWTVDGAKNRNRLRLCFGHPDEETIRVGVAKLAEICHEIFRVPRYAGNIQQGK